MYVPWYLSLHTPPEVWEPFGSHQETHTMSSLGERFNHIKASHLSRADSRADSVTELARNLHNNAQTRWEHDHFLGLLQLMMGICTSCSALQPLEVLWIVNQQWDSWEQALPAETLDKLNRDRKNEINYNTVMPLKALEGECCQRSQTQ